MRRNEAKYSLLLVFAGFQVGCGALIRSAQVRTPPEPLAAQAMARVKVEGVPEGAIVERVHTSGTRELVTDGVFEVPYAVQEHPDPAPGPGGLWVGLGFDLAGAAASAYAATRPDKAAQVIGVSGLVAFGLGAVVDGAWLVSLGGAPSPSASRRVTTEAETVHLIATRGASTWTATVQVPWSDRVSFGALPPGAQPKQGTDTPATTRLAPSSVMQPVPPEPGKRWYGFQTLAVDGLAAAGFFYGYSEDQPEVMWSSVAVYTLVTPLVHAVQGEFGGLAKSLGARALLTGVGAGLGVALGLGLNEVLVGGDLGSGEIARAFAPIGGSLGAIAAMGLDASLIAWTDEEEGLETAERSQLEWTPTIALTPTGRPAVGVAGRF